MLWFVEAYLKLPRYLDLPETVAVHEWIWQVGFRSAIFNRTRPAGGVSHQRRALAHVTVCFGLNQGVRLLALHPETLLAPSLRSIRYRIQNGDAKYDSGMDPLG